MTNQNDLRRWVTLCEVMFPSRPETLFPKDGWEHDAFDKETPSFDSHGGDYGILYHGSSVAISKIDPAKLQRMDPGFYGKGFYLTPDENIATIYASEFNYGDMMNQFRFKSAAKILVVGREEPHNGIIHALRQWLYDTEISKVTDQKAELDLIGSCTVMPWRRNILLKTADRYAVAFRYDAVDYGQEIVVKNYKSVIPIASYKVAK